MDRVRNHPGIRPTREPGPPGPRRWRAFMELATVLAFALGLVILIALALPRP